MAKEDKMVPAVLNEKVECIAGVEYTFKKIPPRQWARLRDRCKNRQGVVLEEKLMEEILASIVVNPRVTLDDFEEWSVAEEVVNAATTFCLGRAGEE